MPAMGLFAFRGVKDDYNPDFPGLKDAKR